MLANRIKGNKGLLYKNTTFFVLMGYLQIRSNRPGRYFAILGQISTRSFKTVLFSILVSLLTPNSNVQM